LNNERLKVNTLFREKQQILICLIAVAVIGGFVLFRFLPLHRRINAVKQAKAAQMMIIAKGISDSEQLPLFTDQLFNLESKLSNFEANIPEQRALGTFVHQIAELMNQHNLKEQEIAPRTEIETDGLSCIPVNIQCKGELTQIFEFYQQLQELDRLIRIKQVKFTNDSDYIGEVSMETDVVIYYRTNIEHG
jgi:Tfp pilus assembly protein PilO